MKWVICDLCGGDGTHVNPAVDSHGLTSEDFDQDPDFAESYFRGDYDVPCRRCEGSGKVLAEKLDKIHEEEDRRAEDRRMAALENGDVEGYHTAYDRRW